MKEAKKKILIVEDEAITAMNLVELMELWGYEACEPATSGEEALRRAEEQRPELVLMDINIRGEMGGIESARRIRDDLAVPVVFITGYADSEVRKLADAAGSAGYLVKPLDFEKLRMIVEKILR